MNNTFETGLFGATCVITFKVNVGLFQKLVGNKRVFTAVYSLYREGGINTEIFERKRKILNYITINVLRKD